MYQKIRSEDKQHSLWFSALGLDYNREVWTYPNKWIKQLYQGSDKKVTIENKSEERLTIFKQTIKVKKTKKGKIGILH